MNDTYRKCARNCKLVYQLFPIVYPFVVNRAICSKYIRVGVQYNKVSHTVMEKDHNSEKYTPQNMSFETSLNLFRPIFW